MTNNTNTTDKLTLTIPTPIGKASANSADAGWCKMDYVAFHNGYAYTTDRVLLAVVPATLSGACDGIEEKDIKIPAKLVSGRARSYGYTLTAHDSAAWINQNNVVAPIPPTQHKEYRILSCLPEYTPADSDSLRTFCINARKLWALSQALGSDILTLILEDNTHPLVAIADTNGDDAIGLVMPCTHGDRDPLTRYITARNKITEGLDPEAW